MKTKSSFLRNCFFLVVGLLASISAITHAQQNIKVYKVGSSSFGDEIMYDAKSMLESAGAYTLTWSSSGYTRLDDFVTMPYMYSDWCTKNLPIIQNGSFNWVIFQTIDWYYLTPAQQEKLLTVIIPDLTAKIRALGPNVGFYDKAVLLERGEKDPLARTWAGCYPQGVRFNYLQHIETSVKSNITKITFGGGAVNELWNVPYFESMDFLYMSGHPGVFADYISACNLSYMLTNGAFNPVGNSVRKIKMAGWAVDAFIDAPTNGQQALYNANVGRIDVTTGLLTLTDWEADTLQRTAIRWHKQWTSTLLQNQSTPATFTATMTEINNIRAERGNFAAYNLSAGLIADLSLKCAEKTCGVDSIDVVNSKYRVWNLTPVVENPTRTYLASGEMNTVTKEWKAFWSNYNSKWTDDIFFEMEIYMALEKKCDSSATAAVEISRLGRVEYVFGLTDALVYAWLVMERLTPTQRDSFIKLIVPKWLSSPGNTQMQPKFGAQLNAVINNWTKVVEVGKVYFQVWKDDPNLMDSLKWSTPPFATKWWIEADNRFAAAWAAHVADATTYSLTVNSGSGSGSYTSASVINIVAAAPPAGKVFDRWSGDIAGVSRHTGSSTLYTMSKANAVITAIYKDPGATSYTLTVTNGTGGGSYTAGTVISINANTPAAGKVFDKWTGSVTNVVNVNSATTTITMPAAATTITATYKDAPSYTLTVTNGTGSGSHPAGSIVNISANAPATGMTFDKWTGDITGITNVNNASTTITMPSVNTAITATYKAAPATYTLTVTSGTGSGTYAAGTIVTISANAPAINKVFDKWTGSVSIIANVNASSTTITMPAANTAITATYKDAPPTTYALTVAGGTGSGSYAAGSVVTITANAPASGKIFDKWIGNISAVANVNAASTTITMPATATTVTATYKNTAPGTYSLTVNGGTGSGYYTPVEQVTIKANTPPTGKEFDKWIGATSGIADVNASTTTYTMASINAVITATYKDFVRTGSDELKVALFPNPSQGRFWIISDVQISKLKIYTISGILIFETQNYVSGAPVEIINDKGLFIVEVTTVEGSTSKLRIFIE